MFRYLKAAFWAAPDTAGLGRIPWNAVAVTGFLILGFGHPGFWMLGMALEATYLYALAMNDRFRRLVDAGAMQEVAGTVEEQRIALVQKLIPPAQHHLGKLEAKCERVLALTQESQAGEFLVDNNRDALAQLRWLYLKLLLARQNLQSAEANSPARDLRTQMERIERDLGSQKITPSLRESKEATRQLLIQRLHALDRREQTLQEIESDLARIEAQVDLALDQAEIRGKPETISANIGLVSQLLDSSVYGDAGGSVAALESTYGPTPQ